MVCVFYSFAFQLAKPHRTGREYKVLAMVDGGGDPDCDNDGGDNVEQVLDIVEQALDNVEHAQIDSKLSQVGPQCH